MNLNTGKLLFDESPLIVQTALAKKIGVDGALFIQQVHYRVFNKQQGSDFSTLKEGYTWIYNTWWGWQEIFPFWNEKKIKRLIKSLEDEKILVGRSDLNQFAYDKTKWYRIDYDVLMNLPERNYFEEEGKKSKDKKRESIIENQKKRKPKGQNVPMSNSNGSEANEKEKSASIPSGTPKGQNVPIEKDKMSLPIPKTSITNTLSSLVSMYVPVQLSSIKLFKEIVKNNPTKYVENEIQKLEEKYGKDLVNESIKRLADKDTTNYIAFLKGVLNNWTKKGATTLEDVKSIEDEHKQQLSKQHEKQPNKRTVHSKFVRTEALPDWFDEEEEKPKKEGNKESGEDGKETFENLMKKRERERKALMV